MKITKYILFITTLALHLFGHTHLHAASTASEENQNEVWETKTKLLFQQNSELISLEEWTNEVKEKAEEYKLKNNNDQEMTIHDFCDAIEKNNKNWFSRSVQSIKRTTIGTDSITLPESVKYYLSAENFEKLSAFFVLNGLIKPQNHSVIFTFQGGNSWLPKGAQIEVPPIAMSAIGATKELAESLTKATHDTADVAANLIHGLDIEYIHSSMTKEQQEEARKSNYEKIYKKLEEKCQEKIDEGKEALNAWATKTMGLINRSVDKNMGEGQKWINRQKKWIRKFVKNQRTWLEKQFKEELLPQLEKKAKQAFKAFVEEIKPEREKVNNILTNANQGITDLRDLKKPALDTINNTNKVITNAEQPLLHTIQEVGKAANNISSLQKPLGEIKGKVDGALNDINGVINDAKAPLIETIKDVGNAAQNISSLEKPLGEIKGKVDGALNDIRSLKKPLLHTKDKVDESIDELKNGVRVGKYCLMVGTGVYCTEKFATIFSNQVGKHAKKSQLKKHAKSAKKHKS
ncbi:MAG: hypothetical protein AAF380_01460 [Bacteroidota bacterium]